MRRLVNAKSGCIQRADIASVVESIHGLEPGADVAAALVGGKTEAREEVRRYDVLVVYQRHNSSALFPHIVSLDILKACTDCEVHRKAPQAGVAVRWTLAADRYCRYISALITDWRKCERTGWRAVWRSLLFSCYSKSRHGYSSGPAIAWHDSPRSHTTWGVRCRAYSPLLRRAFCLSCQVEDCAACPAVREVQDIACIQGSLLSRLHLR